MENNDVRKNAENAQELRDEDVQEVAGGAYDGTYEQDPQGWINQDNWYARHRERVNPPKWPCPKCGSWEVTNLDPGALYMMRVHCKACGFFGCRDGSHSW